MTPSSSEFDEISGLFSTFEQLRVARVLRVSPSSKCSQFAAKPFGFSAPFENQLASLAAMKPSQIAAVGQILRAAGDVIKCFQLQGDNKLFVAASGFSMASRPMEHGDVVRVEIVLFQLGDFFSLTCDELASSPCQDKSTTSEVLLRGRDSVVLTDAGALIVMPTQMPSESNPPASVSHNSAPQRCHVSHEVQLAARTP